jgi:hypothetical protein
MGDICLFFIEFLGKKKNYYNTKYENIFVKFHQKKTESLPLE